MRVVNQAYELVPVEAVKPHPQNPRQGDVGAIHGSVRQNGFYGALVVQRSTGHILAGNHRYRAARHDGATEVPVIWVECDDEQALRILLADNRTADLATQDEHVLATLLQGLTLTPNVLAGTGYDTDDLDQMLADLGRTDPFGDLVQGSTLSGRMDFEVAVRVPDAASRDALMAMLTAAGYQPVVKAVSHAAAA